MHYPYSLVFTHPTHLEVVLRIDYPSQNAALVALDAYHTAFCKGRDRVKLPEDQDGQTHLIPSNIPFFVKTTPIRGTQ